MPASLALSIPVCSELDFKKSTYGQNKIKSLNQVLLTGVNLANINMVQLKEYYLENVDIPQPYVLSCYERLLDWSLNFSLERSEKSNDLVEQKLPLEKAFDNLIKNPIESVGSAFDKIFSGLGKVVDYIIIVLVLAAVLFGFYLINKFLVQR